MKSTPIAIIIKRQSVYGWHCTIEFVKIEIVKIEIMNQYKKYGESAMNDFLYCKIEIFIPETHLAVLQDALQSVDAGHIGNYDSCLSYSRVTGCWRPLEGSDPYIGRENAISSEAELKVEVTCLREKIDCTIDAIKKIHPYEVPVINVIPLYRTSF